MTPQIRTTPIEGLCLIDLDVHRDVRGWFKENWRAGTLEANGLPALRPVQHNISFNDSAGTTRGIHAEPWDKYVSVATGRVFGAWVDLRPGPGFGTVATAVIDPATAVLVPRGVGNAYQTLDDDTAYTYLVTAQWQPGTHYAAVNVADPALAIDWPIPLERAVISDKDRANPPLSAVHPLPPRRTLVLGAAGQLGSALRAAMPDADFLTRTDLDVTDPAAIEAFAAAPPTGTPWSDYATIINAAAHTDVDGAETATGRAPAWRVNAAAVGDLATIATANNLTLVHFSSDYVFDGTRERHREDEPVSPLNVYGQSKAAGDIAAGTTRRHYILRTSWVVGEDPERSNFVTTMIRLARRGTSPAVVADQLGRLTFAAEIARAVTHLIDSAAPYGLYHLSNSGPAMSWYDIATRVFERCAVGGAAPRPCSTDEYRAAHPGTAARPHHSTLDLAKIIATGWSPTPAADALDALIDRATRT